MKDLAAAVLVLRGAEVLEVDAGGVVVVI